MKRIEHKRKNIGDRVVDIVRAIGEIEHRHNVNMHQEFAQSRARHRKPGKPSPNISDSHDRR